jgi:hypothetical protein
MIAIVHLLTKEIGRQMMPIQGKPKLWQVMNNSLALKKLFKVFLFVMMMII